MYTHDEQEFDRLQTSNAVYKLVGPVLVKEDQAEAKANGTKRLEFIRNEMCVTTISDSDSIPYFDSKRVELRDQGSKGEDRK